jgi:uncharacterized membrane protein
MTNETNNKAVSVTDEPKNPIVNDRGLTFVVYVLYLAGYFTGITTLIGVIIAYLQRASVSSILKSHNTFQIRTP